MRLETILLVDDNLASRRLIRLILDKEGFRVLMAKDLDKALTLCRGRIHFDLLIVDAILRTRRGKLVAECFNELRPGVPVLFTSGHSFDELTRQGLVDAEPFQQRRAGFIQKPFTVKGLLGKVTELLASRQPKTFRAR